MRRVTRAVKASSNPAHTAHAVASPAYKVLCQIQPPNSGGIPCCATRRQAATARCSAGTPNPTSTGTAHTSEANAPPPGPRARRVASAGPALAWLARRRAARSSAIRAATTPSRHSAICAAPSGEERVTQVVYTARVRVSTPRNSAAPTSFSASIKARPTPTATAGQASGTATRRNSTAPDAPSVRAASSTSADCMANAARALR